MKKKKEEEKMKKKQKIIKTFVHDKFEKQNKKKEKVIVKLEPMVKVELGAAESPKLTCHCILLQFPKEHKMVGSAFAFLIRKSHQRLLVESMSIPRLLK